MKYFKLWIKIWKFTALSPIIIFALLLILGIAFPITLIVGLMTLGIGWKGVNPSINLLCKLADTKMWQVDKYFNNNEPI